MRIRNSLFLFLILAPLAAHAEVGDIHTVKTDNAIVREGPGKNEAQVDKLNSGAEIMEMDVQGEWYEIYVASTDLSGWLHVSTLELLGGGVTAPAAEPEPAAPSAPTPSAAPAPAPRVAVKGPKSGAMKTFEKYFHKYNARTNVLKGYVPFTNAEDIGSGSLQLTVSSQWLEKSKARQKSSLITLYSRWKKASSGGAVKVIAQDQSGNQIAAYPK